MQQEVFKRIAAERAVTEFVRDGQVVGLGTGSTAAFALEKLGQLVAGGLKIRGVPTSLQTELKATELGIPLIELNEVERIDITIDGADEVDPGFNMIKGGGGALTREKLIAIASEREVIVIDSSKLVSRLGQSRPVPVEVLPFGWRLAARSLGQLGCSATLRRKNGEPFLTDNGNYILDCDFGPISDPAELERRIKLLPAVLECGIFIGLAHTLVIGSESGVALLDKGRP
jgi:ribose 5-phosphate isomerase A